MVLDVADDVDDVASEFAARAVDSAKTWEPRPYLVVIDCRTRFLDLRL